MSKIYFIGPHNRSKFDLLEVLPEYEKELIEPSEGFIILVSVIIALISGCFINLRIYLMLKSKQNSAKNSYIDRLLFVHTKFNLFSYPIMLIFSGFKPFVFPISNLIGTFGCAFILLILDIFIRLQPLILSVAIALTRYSLIIVSKHYYIKRAANIILYGSYILSAFIVIFIQLPPSEYGQASFYVCIGRFEVFFNPLHPDAVSPGRRREIDVCQRWNQPFDEESEQGRWQPAIQTVFFIGCRISALVIIAISSGIPQIFLYFRLYRNIHLHNKRIFSMNLLKPEVERQRHKQGKMNIHTTCLAWIIEGISNAFNVFYAKYLYGMSPFVHLLSSVLQLSFNFVFMPFLFVIVADVEIRSALYHGRIKEAAELFLNI